MRDRDLTTAFRLQPRNPGNLNESRRAADGERSKGKREPTGDEHPSGPPRHPEVQIIGSNAIDILRFDAVQGLRGGAGAGAGADGAVQDESGTWRGKRREREGEGGVLERELSGEKGGGISIPEQVHFLHC